MTHLGFPLRLDARGRIAIADRDDWIAGLVEQVLFTTPGERLNRPTFGAALADLVFEPIDAGLSDATTALVMAALQSELGELIRVEAIEVRVADATVHVTLRYQPLHLPAGEIATLSVSGGTP